jgi:hypothetical protein
MGSLTAFCAYRLVHPFSTASSSAKGLSGGAAFRASGRLVFESLFGIKFLFRSRKNKISSAFLTIQSLILIHKKTSSWLCPLSLKGSDYFPGDNRQREGIYNQDFIKIRAFLVVYIIIVKMYIVKLNVSLPDLFIAV